MPAPYSHSTARGMTDDVDHAQLVQQVWHLTISALPHHCHLMRGQDSVFSFSQRRKLCNQVQEIEGRGMSSRCLLKPNMLIGAKRVGNHNPVVLDPFTLRNSDEINIRYDQGQAVP
jgi:hypothetical protein